METEGVRDFETGRDGQEQLETNVDKIEKNRNNHQLKEIETDGTEIIDGTCQIKVNSQNCL